VVNQEIEQQVIPSRRPGRACLAAFLFLAIGPAALASPKLAKITPFQRAVIERLVTPGKRLPAEAASEIKRFLAEMSCRFDASRQAFDFSVGPADKRTPYNDSGVMAEMSSAHRLTVCLTVEEVRWVELKADVLGFEVVFRSDDSLEALTKRYSATRQPQGQWHFTYHASQTR
jgi:hypothetical protein